MFFGFITLVVICSTIPCANSLYATFAVFASSEPAGPPVGANPLTNPGAKNMLGSSFDTQFEFVMGFASLSDGHPVIHSDYRDHGNAFQKLDIIGPYHVH